MADNDTDFDDVLEGTVDEVKDAIDDLDDVDLDELLDAEKNGKDRKTVKEHIESLMDSDEEEEEAEDEEIIEEVEESEEELVEDIEEETEGGILGSFSREAVMAGGLAVGVLVGIIAASYIPALGGANPASVQDDVRYILTGGQDVNGTVEISEPVKRHGMYFLNASITQDTGNETVTRNQGVYVTLDGEKLIPVREQLGRTLMPIDIDSTISQIEAQSQQTEQPSGNATQ